MHRFKQATDTLREIFVYYILTMLIAAYLFHLVEMVSFYDSLYWAGVTMTTVGYGDISPHTLLGKILSVILANISIFVLAPLVVAHFLEHVMDDRDKLTHEEQEIILSTLTRIATRLDRLDKAEK
jgi:voltage-gated potassium channel